MMALWRSPAVESVLGASLDETGLTEDVIKRLVVEGVRESEQLDFKLSPHLSATNAADTASLAKSSRGQEPGWSAEQEFAKDICSFANHLGGVLLIGVDEKDEVAVDTEPTVVDVGGVEQRMRNAIANYATPAPRFQCIPILAAAGGNYMAIIVPPSPSSPHAVRGALGNARRPLHYPVRDGAGIRWLLEHEIADRYHARAASRAEHTALREETIAQGLQALEHAADDGLWLYLAVVPESPAPERLDRSTADAMRAWLQTAGLYSPLGNMLLFHADPTPAPGRLTVSGSAASREHEEDTDPRDHYLEIYADGRVFVATSLDTRKARTEPSALAELTLVDDTIMVTDLGVAWASHQAGAWGRAELVVGITAKGQTTGSFPEPLTLHAGIADDLNRLRGTRPVRGPIRANTATDLADGHDLQGRLRAARDVLTVLLHHFGVAETDQLKADGTIKRYGWGRTRSRSDIERWAQEHDVSSADH